MLYIYKVYRSSLIWITKLYYNWYHFTGRSLGGQSLASCLRQISLLKIYIFQRYKDKVYNDLPKTKTYQRWKWQKKINNQQGSRHMQSSTYCTAFGTSKSVTFCRTGNNHPKVGVSNSMVDRCISCRFVRKRCSDSGSCFQLQIPLSHSWACCLPIRPNLIILRNVPDMAMRQFWKNCISVNFESLGHRSCRFIPSIKGSIMIFTRGIRIWTIYWALQMVCTFLVVTKYSKLWIR